MSDDFSDAAAKAEARGRKALASEPRARSARYNARTGEAIVRLTNGCGFSFPARKVQGLEKASDRDLADVEVLGLGPGLHWERLDVVDPGLLSVGPAPLERPQSGITDSEVARSPKASKPPSLSSGAWRRS